MRMNEQFDAATRAAMHSDELLGGRTLDREEGGAFAEFGEAVAAAFAPLLAALFGVDTPQFAVSEAETVSPEQLADKLGRPSGNLLLPVGEPRSRIFASFSLAPLMVQLNRIFGGEISQEPAKGEADKADKVETVDQAFPASLRLFVRKLETLLVEAMGDCLDAEIVDRSQPAQLDPDFASLAPFPSHGPVTFVELRFMCGGEEDLRLVIACRKSAIDRFLGHRRKDDKANPPMRRLLTNAMSEVELRLRARLVDMALPASRLATLAPGNVLPIAISRSVPLFVGDKVIARASIGELDDRVAMKVESINLMGESA